MDVCAAAEAGAYVRVTGAQDALGERDGGAPCAGHACALAHAAAAIGLWLTSAWGGVVWLFAATSALTLGLLTPQLLSMSAPLLGVQASIVVAYFILSWLAAREIR